MKIRQKSSQAAFTLVEVMIVVMIIGLLAAIAIPAFTTARRTSQVTAVANNLIKFGDAFSLYALEHGDYPPDCHVDEPWHLPNTAMESYLERAKWKAETQLGGNYNWEGPDGYPYAGIAIFNYTASEGTFRELDQILDDGDLTTGHFRKTPNGRYTYILEE